MLFALENALIREPSSSVTSPPWEIEKRILTAATPAIAVQHPAKPLAHFLHRLGGVFVFAQLLHSQFSLHRICTEFLT